MAKLTVSTRPYDGRLLREWKRGRLKRQHASKALLGLLKRKARTKAKKTSRFFGEAFVANATRHREGLYGSFKWLTNRRFLGTKPFPNGPAKQQQEQLRRALGDHFGNPKLRELQQAARQLHRSRRRLLKGKLPTAPDLWLVDKRGSHRFIEVKLPGDFLAPHQLAGMALIACILKVSVEVIELRNDQAIFQEFCRAIGSSARRT